MLPKQIAEGKEINTLKDIKIISSYCDVLQCEMVSFVYAWTKNCFLIEQNF